MGGVEVADPDECPGQPVIGLASLLGSSKALRVLCIGAHCDDIEIGCGATLLRLAGERPLDVTWLILCSTAGRALEARSSAASFLKKARSHKVNIETFRDGYLPAHWGQVKERIESLTALATSDLIFTHDLHDRHQDHRVISELTWNTFRDHVILEYEIPKYEGGLGQPNLYVPVSRAVAERKTRHVLHAYSTQRRKRWFSSETFLGLMRLRGVECNAPHGLAEAFYARKLVI